MWMNLESVMMGQIRRIKVSIMWFHLYEISGIIKFINTSGLIRGYQGLEGRRRKEWLLHGYRVSVGGWKRCGTRCWQWWHLLIAIDGAEDMAQVVKCLPSKHKALSSKHQYCQIFIIADFTLHTFYHNF
jgi:hypothetical protein